MFSYFILSSSYLVRNGFAHSYGALKVPLCYCCWCCCFRLLYTFVYTEKALRTVRKFCAVYKVKYYIYSLWRRRLRLQPHRRIVSNRTCVFCVYFVCCVDRNCPSYVHACAPKKREQTCVRRRTTRVSI